MYKKYKKMFQTKVIAFEEGHKRVSLIWSWLAPPKSDQSHFEFFEWNLLAFIAHYYSHSWNLFKTI